jgi:hypothetical protein
VKFAKARLSSSATALLFVALAARGTAQAAPPVHNIVLVYGAWVTGAGWQPLYDVLLLAGCWRWKRVDKVISTAPFSWPWCGSSSSCCSGFPSANTV